MALPTKVVSHAQRVRNLYKESIRALEGLIVHRHEFRYNAVLMRARFDENKDIKDPAIAMQLLEEGEDQLLHCSNPQPIKFPDSPGGISYGRETKIPDWVLDMWHPLERAQYPEYFARRHQRKLEYIKKWEEKYGKAETT